MYPPHTPKKWTEPTLQQHRRRSESTRLFEIRIRQEGRRGSPHTARRYHRIPASTERLNRSQLRAPGYPAPRGAYPVVVRLSNVLLDIGQPDAFLHNVLVTQR